MRLYFTLIIKGNVQINFSLFIFLLDRVSSYMKKLENKLLSIPLYALKKMFKFLTEINLISKILKTWE